MTLTRIISLSLVVASALTAAKAQDGGSTAYNFLNVTSSSHIYGLGGVNISTIEDDITIVEQNPALLGSEMSNQVAFNYMRYLGESNFAGLRYGHSAGERAAWSAAIQYFGYGTIKGTDEFGNPIGDFSPKDVAFSASYSHDITSSIRGGITLKGIYSGYEQYSAFAIAADLGINYYNPDTDLSVSAVIANLGGQVKKFNNTYDKLPTDLRIGFTKGLSSMPIRLSLTAWNLTKWHLPYYKKVNDGYAGSTSTETFEIKDSFASNLLRHLIFAIDIVPNDRYYISVAYNNKTRTDMETFKRNMLSGWSLGAGLSVRKFAVGIALAQPHTGTTTFMLNLRLNINDILNR